jgi:hypothetical protein
MGKFRYEKHYFFEKSRIIFKDILFLSPHFAVAHYLFI